MEESDNKFQENYETSKKVPRLFIVSGEIVRRFGWIGYLMASGAIVISIMVIFREYKSLASTSFPGYFIAISAWFWLSIGFVKFSKSYAQGIQEGNRNAILSFILLIFLFCLLAGFTAFYRFGVDLLVFGISVAIFALTLFLNGLMTFGLIFYRNRLEGGINIYEE